VEVPVIQVLLLIAGVAAVPPDLGSWQVLADGEIKVAHTTARGLPWARAQAELPGSKDTVVALLRDFRGYPDFMERIFETRVYEADVVHLILDMPFPLAHRDYVVKYTESKQGEVVIFDFVAVDHPAATAVDGSVRLPRAEGQWRIEPLGPAKTRVTYIWNGELLGDFPDWALTKAWVTQGQEVLGWLEDAL
jgi:ribosome-associated toxin RatA of RatAB toxin-antitoxin module